MAREFFKNLPDTSTPLNAQRMNGFLNGEEAMGSIVVDDIKSKNLFNINNLVLKTGSINYSTGVITVNQYDNQSTNALKDIAPDLVAGETYTLSLSTTGNNRFIFLFGSNSIWLSGNQRILTQEELDEKIIVYGISESTETVNISNIQIEKGSLTPYTPYKAYGIVESGSNSNGEWVKWDDGTMICRATHSINAPINIQYGALYRTDGMALPDYPAPFIKKPEVTFSSVGSNSCFITNWGVGTSTKPNTLLLMKPATAETTDYLISYIAIGRWK